MAVNPLRQVVCEVLWTIVEFLEWAGFSVGWDVARRDEYINIVYQYAFRSEAAGRRGESQENEASVP
jgi:hypothetical protein